MNKVKFNILIILLFAVYLQGFLDRTLMATALVQGIVDISALLFIFFNFKFNMNTPGSIIFILFLILSVLIGMINSDGIVESFMYTRFVIYSYLIYQQLYNSFISDKQWLQLGKILIILVILQGIGALYNVFILGERVEGFVGLMSSLGGTTATIFPLLIVVILAVFYLFKPKFTRYELFLLLIVLFSVFLVGYSSGKRTIYFIIPLMFFLTIIISLPSLINRTYFKRKLIGISLLSILIFPLIIFGMVNSSGLNYSLTGEESSLEVIMNSIEYAEEYESATDEYGLTTGRSNTSAQVIERLSRDDNAFFSGYGYGQMKDESTMYKLGFGYGIVGFSRDLISGGFILFLITFLLLANMILRKSSKSNKFSKSIRLSIFVVFIYTHFFYSSDFTVSLKLNLIMVIVLSFINSYTHRNSFGKFLKYTLIK